MTPKFGGVLFKVKLFPGLIWFAWLLPKCRPGWHYPICFFLYSTFWHSRPKPPNIDRLIRRLGGWALPFRSNKSLEPYNYEHNSVGRVPTFFVGGRTVVFPYSLTSIIATNKTLLSRGVESKWTANKLLVEGALNFAGNFIFDIVDYRVQITWISIVCALIWTIKITYNERNGKAWWSSIGTRPFVMERIRTLLDPELTGLHAGILQILHVTRISKGLGLRPSGLSTERTCQCHRVILGRLALKCALSQAQLFAISSGGHIGKVLVVETLEHAIWYSLEGPGFIATLRYFATETDFFEIAGAISRCQRVATALKEG